MNLKKVFANRTARILAIAAAALLLLLLCWAVFRTSESSAAGNFSQTTEEARLSVLLSKIEGAGEVTVLITEENGEPASAVVIFSGEDAILTRLRLTQVAAASLNIAENRVLVCPAEK